MQQQFHLCDAVGDADWQGIHIDNSELSVNVLECVNVCNLSCKARPY